MRIRMTAVVALCSVGALAVGCAGGDDDEQAGGDAKAAEADKADDDTAVSADLPANGQIILVDDEGAMTSVRPDGSDPKDIEGPPVDRATVTRTPGVVVFSVKNKESDVVVVNAAKGTAKVISGASADPAASPQVGRRYMVHGGSLLLNLGSGEAVELPVSGEGLQLGMSPDERFVLAQQNDALTLVSLDDGKQSAVPGRAGLFSADGSSVSAYESDGQDAGIVRRVPVGGGESQTVAEGPNVIIHGIAGDSVLVVEEGDAGDTYFLTKAPGDRRTVDLPLGEEDSLDFGRLSSKRFALLTTAEQRYFLFDVDKVTAKPLDELAGLHWIPGADKRYVLFSSFGIGTSQPEAGGVGKYGLLDLQEGTLSTASYDPGPLAIYLQPPLVPQFSPDGKALVVSVQPSEGPESTVVVPWGRGQPVPIDGLFVGWSPHGSAVLVIRFEDPDNPRLQGPEGPTVRLGGCFLTRDGTRTERQRTAPQHIGGVLRGVAGSPDRRRGPECRRRRTCHQECHKGGYGEHPPRVEFVTHASKCDHLSRMYECVIGR